jgi:3',5'-cyclic AMP phosphodiesterase CpdA
MKLFRFRCPAAVRVLVFLSLLSACYGQNFFFIQIADPQFGMFTGNKGFAQETANFEFVIATVNRLQPAFVIACGDLTNKAGDEEQIREFFRISHDLNRAIPMYYVAGNHDVGNTPTRQSLELYRKHFGADRYVFHVGDFEGIVINSSLIQHPEGVPDEAAAQEEWLKGELDKASAAKVKQVVVFQHIPWFLNSADEPDQYFNIPKEARTRYLSLLKSHGVRYVFAGHLHNNSFGTDGPLKMITTGPVGKPLGSASSGIRVVTMKGDNLENQYYSLGNLPPQAPDLASAKQ